METLHDLLFWVLIALAGCLPVFMVMWVWMALYTRKDQVSERIKEGLELNSGAFAAGVTVKIVGCLVICYALAYVSLGALSEGAISTVSQVGMAFLPTTTGTLLGVVVVMMGKLMYEQE